ncbi:uncharacterized protein IL334_005709 [Kwoniella shivajii]|uniref:Alpha/beta hydrolase fold-3 domain-containing protein n=1 Tax=Kwoniella shivajii TaxID=564305 RepID=A0ABZ1D5F2_9TREE|nr:hypothetical protein IL334_005709 [Kwoniella shivajii]
MSVAFSASAVIPTPTPAPAPAPAPSWSLLLRAKALRQAASVSLGIQHYTTPIAPSPSLTEYIDSAIGSSPATKCIRLDIYHPPNTPTENDNEIQKRPGLIVFHGGGFVIGQGTDDSRFAQAAMDILGCTVFAVSYRLAPEHPFPIPVEDCLSSIIHIIQFENARKYGIDNEKILLSGFSAGGNLSFSALNILNSPNDCDQYQYNIPNNLPKIKGIILFYPLLNYSIRREDKLKTISKPEYGLPTSLTTLFDSSYLPNAIERGIDRKEIRISPGLASDILIKELPPVFITLCEYDMLRQEGIDFIHRLEGLGKDVKWSEVKGEKHGWDKQPSMWIKPSIMEEYTKALNAAKEWLDGEL